MPLTPEQQARLRDAFGKIWPEHSRCPMCHSGTWQISDSIFSLPEYMGGLFPGRGGAIFPVIPISCGNCGYVIFFNAIQLGILDPGRPR